MSAASVQTQPSGPDSIEQHNDRIDKLLDGVGFDGLDVEAILKWTADAFDPARVVLNTSFQMAGVAMIHMVASARLPIRIATIDTLRLPAETHTFIQQIQERYGIDIEIQRPETEKIERMVRRFGEYLFFDGKHLQEHCCKVRKVDPNSELMKSADCWISGVRRDQSALRQQTPKAMSATEYGSKRKILRLNPMADWSLDRLQAFVDENDVPQHPLYAQGYQSIGCVICSTPTLPGEDPRAGRWRWFNSPEDVDAQDAKECGLHIPMYNI